MAEIPQDILDKIRDVNGKVYKDQAVWFLNAFWHEVEAEKERVWSLCEAFIKEDKDTGNELNPIQAFHLLQQRNETLTALELKAQLRKVDIDANGEMSLLEYLLFSFEKSPIKCITNPQGGSEDGGAELAKAQDNLDAVSKLFDDLSVKLEAQKQAEAQLKKQEAEAVAADEELKAQQDAYNNEIDRLTALSTDQTVGIVKRNTAVQQLAQLKGADPLPLQKAKLTQEATVRRVAKAREAAEKETAAAEEKANECFAKLKEAEEYLEEIKRKSAVAFGSIWWMERTLQEKKKYLPQRFQ